MPSASLGDSRPKTPRRYGLPSPAPRSSFPTPRSAPVTGQRAAPPAHHVVHAETRPLLVEADRVERPAVPANHVPMLFVRRIEDRLQKAHEPVRAADVLRRTAPGPVHEGRIFPVRGAVANLLDDHIVAPVVAVVVGADDLPTLNSFFRNRYRAGPQTVKLRYFLLGLPPGKTVVLVTHQVNITALTGRIPSSGEVFLLEIGRDCTISVVDEILIDPWR